jgi:hypothetical protein
MMIVINATIAPMKAATDVTLGCVKSSRWTGFPTPIPCIVTYHPVYRQTNFNA